MALESVLTRYSPVGNLHSSYQGFLAALLSVSVIRTFSVAALRLRNALPANTRRADTISLFS